MVVGLSHEATYQGSDLVNTYLTPIDKVFKDIIAMTGATTVKINTPNEEGFW